MGTRNLVCVVLNREYLVAQYGQWDGYPSGQGLTLLRFLRDTMDRNLFLAKLTMKTRWAEEEELKENYLKAGADPNSMWMTMEVVEHFNRLMPYLSRDHGAGVLDLIQNASGEVLLQNSHDFAADSLYCEYAYVVDFDNDTLEVYRGFNQKRLDPLDPKERFSSLQKVKHPGSENYQIPDYYPVKHWHTFDLRALPSDEEFLNTLKEESEEE